MPAIHRTDASMSSNAPRRRTPRRPDARRPAGAPRALPSVLLGAVLLCAPTAHAFEDEELNAAQVLIYDTPHLAGTDAGQEIAYAWTETGGADGALEDRATLEVTAAHEDGRRDVTLDFLTGERRLELPAFEGWRGNPVLMATLERFAQDFATAGGGGALYFRNRMRDALADAPSTEDVELDWAGGTVAGTRIEFAPFVDDPYVGSRPGLADATVRLALSDAVPGGVLAAAVESSGDGAAEGAEPFRRELRLDDGGAR